MTNHQKAQEGAMSGEGETTKSGPSSATAALAAAVAKRAEARTLIDKKQGKARHGGKPVLNVRMAAQVRGK